MTACSRRSIAAAATACSLASHGTRSLSFSGVPSRIFAIDSGEW